LALSYNINNLKSKAHKVKNISMQTLWAFDFIDF